MSKIICDVCGSAYSDTASQCPICGTAKRDTNPTVSSPAETTADASYNYVKGGRFSHANVRKHNSGKALQRKPAEKSQDAPTGSSMPALPVEPKPAKPEQRPQPKPKAEKPARPKQEAAPKPVTRRENEKNKSEQRTNLILVIVVLILLVAVIFVGIYVVRNYKDLFPSGNPSDSTPGTQQTVGGVRIPCVGITLPALEQLESDGEPVALDFVFTPSTTTDKKTFVPSDPSIATVDNNGAVTVHGNGQVTITVTCGDQTAELVLNCVLVTPTDPTDPSKPTDPVVPEGTLKFVNANGKEATDVTFNKYGEEYQLYGGDIDASLVTFTSSDPAIVTIDAAGKIKIVGKGIATVYAEYGNQKIECKIICSKVEPPAETAYMIEFCLKDDPTNADITIKVGDKQTIRLLNIADRAPVTGLNWYTSMDGYIKIEVTQTGVRVTGLEVTGPGVYYVRVMCDYEGVTYTCKVRVKAAPETPAE